MTRRGNIGTAGTDRGWPVVNYATDLRGFNGIKAIIPMSIPRFRFTFLVEFNINPMALEFATTNFADYLHDGKLYTHLKSIEHPKVDYEIETLRSYNKYIKIPTKTEYSPTSLTFHDDSTSIISSLWLDYMNFFQYSGNIGQQVIPNTSEGSDIGSMQYQYLDRLTPDRASTDTRASMRTRPSLGMKLKPNGARSFFDSIVIYDLGTEPTSLNIYYFHKPFFKSVSYTQLDQEDRTGKQEINISLEYESHYFATGQNRDDYAGVFESHLGYSSPTGTAPKAGSSKVINGAATDLAAKILAGIPVDIVSIGETVAGASGEASEAYSTIKSALSLIPTDATGAVSTALGLLNSAQGLQDRIGDVTQIISGINGVVEIGKATPADFAQLQEASVLKNTLTNTLKNTTQLAFNKSMTEISNAATKSATDLTKRLFNI